MTVKLFAKYKPHEEQKKFHKSTARFKNLCAGVRSGKTYGAAREFIKQIRRDVKIKNKKNFLYWAVAPDYVIGQTQMEEVFKVLTEPFGIHYEEIRKSPFVRYWNENKKTLGLVFKVKKNGKTIKKFVRIRFRSAERPESLVADTVDGTWVDEAARLKPAAWPNIRARGVTTQGWVIFSTTPFGRNWYYDQVYLLGDKGSEQYNPEFENFVFYTVHNTAVPGIQAEVELARKQMPEKYFKRDFMASFDTFTGQIYDNFDRKKHLVPRQYINEIIQSGKIKTFIMGKDWGDTNPGTSVVIGVDGDFNFFVVDLIYKTQTNVDSSDPTEQTWVKMDKELFKRYPIEYVYADPEDAAYIRIYKKNHFPITKVDKTVNAGIQAVSTLLHVNERTGKPKLFICEDLRELINEMQSYQWAENRSGDLKEEPVKKNDHAMDALRYALYNYCLKFMDRPQYTAYDREELDMEGW
ncbi:terminase large subunit [Paenibacillus sp. TAB 01]|uniref:terminase large subunit n=1 Tax=Paenibacillus sp. TAB 01 TaxID=3368988 RepID=UPI00374FDCD8